MPVQAADISDIYSHVYYDIINAAIVVMATFLCIFFWMTISSLHNFGLRPVLWTMLKINSLFEEKSLIYLLTNDCDMRPNILKEGSFVGDVSYTTWNPVFGNTKNPHDTTRGPGGSSGGESALIALNGSPLGFGTDIGGSIRNPCHFCGLAGLKPTGNRIRSDKPNQLHDSPLI